MLVQYLKGETDSVSFPLAYRTTRINPLRTGRQGPFCSRRRCAYWLSKARWSRFRAVRACLFDLRCMLTFDEKQRGQRRPILPLPIGLAGRLPCIPLLWQASISSLEMMLYTRIRRARMAIDGDPAASIQEPFLVWFCLVVSNSERFFTRACLYRAIFPLVPRLQSFEDTPCCELKRPHSNLLGSFIVLRLDVVSQCLVDLNRDYKTTRELVEAVVKEKTHWHLVVLYRKLSRSRQTRTWATRLDI
jgi:hypothetical protein